MASLANTRVLVIGGSSGIGEAVARRSAESGAEVTIASRSADKLTRAAETIGHGVQTAVLDTRDNTAIEGFFADNAPWDHLIVSSAATARGGMRSMSLEDAYASMDSKFWGAYRAVRAARMTDGGTITLVSGFLSERPSAGATLQGAINAALEGLMRGLALELAPVRVNAVSPGMIDTPLWADMPEARRRELMKTAASDLPVGRVGRAGDIANAVHYLMITGFATGSVVRVDGGGAIA
ncbi:SDR family oxidoreductase [Salinisphaera hydrothermalis]|uniref:Short chain dehydrogenase n=1 Tax=Salinisphaera hydrothermalis (strain C41B8) TaxID=1304275 RepID=A0A084IJG8_SALHC|nr:SDR family oxidoreductase [Salinisphaera hydrothermalis]KEZ76852.1 short chain dehydrogenase [Salinisphaera hydrothermalis C41B8]